MLFATPWPKSLCVRKKIYKIYYVHHNTLEWMTQDGRVLYKCMRIVCIYAIVRQGESGLPIRDGLNECE